MPTGPDGVTKIRVAKANSNHIWYGKGSNYKYTFNGMQPTYPIGVLAGKTYIFEIDTPGHPFYFSTNSVGATNNEDMNQRFSPFKEAVEDRTIIVDGFEKYFPQNFYANCNYHSFMGAPIVIIENPENINNNPSEKKELFSTKRKGKYVHSYVNAVQALWHRNNFYVVDQAGFLYQVLNGQQRKTILDIRPELEDLRFYDGRIKIQKENPTLDTYFNTKINSVTEYKSKMEGMDLVRPNILRKYDERGFLGVVFYKECGIFYYYVKANSHPIVSKNKMLIDLCFFCFKTNTTKILLEWETFYYNHNGGGMFIDYNMNGKHYLYLGVGDGGSQGDPENNAQDINSLFGKILRFEIAPNRKTMEMFIKAPQDNPFYKVCDTCYLSPGQSEMSMMDYYQNFVYAYGLRNPWGLYQDARGNIWCADPGEREEESILLIEKGRNYGWNIFEGNNFYRKTSEYVKQNISIKNFTFPYLAYKSMENGAIVGVRYWSLINGIVFADYNGSVFIVPEIQKNKDNLQPQRILKLKDTSINGIFSSPDESEIFILVNSGGINNYTKLSSFIVKIDFKA